MHMIDGIKDQLDGLVAEFSAVKHLLDNFRIINLVDFVLIRFSLHVHYGNKTCQKLLRISLNEKYLPLFNRSAVWPDFISTL